MSKAFFMMRRDDVNVPPVKSLRRKKGDEKIHKICAYIIYTSYESLWGAFSSILRWFCKWFIIYYLEYNSIQLYDKIQYDEVITY